MTIARQRFPAFDGLRGVAAGLVLCDHIGVPGMTHGYLAVDLFFLLSGFVISHAYEARLASSLTLSGFARERMIRLYPLIFLGAMLGYLVAITNIKPVAQPNLALLGQLLFIPILWGQPFIFMLNGLQWSLFFEVVANGFHAAWGRALSITELLIGVALAALGLVFIARHFQYLGLGWGPDNFYCGFVRVAFSYGLGVVFYRLHALRRLPRLRAPWPLLMAAPVAMVLLAEHHLGWLADPLIIIIGFPLVIWAAVSVQIPAMVRPAAELGGFLSYPVYALQTPMQFAAIALFRRLGWEHSHKAWLGFGVAVVAVCWLIGRYYDVPLRDWLARWPRSKAAAIQP